MNYFLNVTVMESWLITSAPEITVRDGQCFAHLLLEQAAAIQNPPLDWTNTDRVSQP